MAAGKSGRGGVPALEQFVQKLGGERIVELFRKLQVIQKSGDKSSKGHG